MLIEIASLRQVDGEGFRRWFTDDRFDLIVWYSEQAEDVRRIVGFQICYAKDDGERALSWRREGGFVHEIVDNGEYPGNAKMTPVLRGGGEFDQSMPYELRSASADCPREITEFMLEKLEEYQTKVLG